MYRPLLSILLFFIFGIILHDVYPVSFVPLLFLSVGFLLLSFLCIKQRRVSGTLLLMVFFLLGVIFTKSFSSLPVDDVNHIVRYYQGKPVSLEGTIVSDVEVRNFFNGKKTSFTLEVKRFQTKWGWRNKKGRLLVNIFTDTDLTFGDHIFLKGKLHRPFNFKSDGKFSYPNYLRYRGIHFILSVKKDERIEILSRRNGSAVKFWSFKLRNRLKQVLAEHLTENESGIMQAILLGDRTHIPKHIRELFVRTGTAHILAISGLHIGIVTALIFVFLKLFPIPRKARYLLTIVLLIGYAFLTGGRASVVRATIMATILLFSVVIERETNPLNSLSLAALIILMINPLNIFDLSFQLSFVSVLSIVCFYPKLIKFISKLPMDTHSKGMSFLCQSFSVSLAAWLGVMGIIAYYFHIVTPVTIIANLVVIPLIGIVVALGLGLLLMGVVIPFGAFAFAYCLKIILNVMVVATYLFDQFPLSHFYLKDVSLWGVMGYYMFIWSLFYLRPVKFLPKSLSISN